MTGRKSDLTKKRADELAIHSLTQGVLDKLPVYEKLKEEFEVQDSEIMVMGDDLMELPMMYKCGLSVTVPGGRPELKEEADIITEAEAGRGAAREIIEFVLKKEGKWEAIMERYKDKS